MKKPEEPEFAAMQKIIEAFHGLEQKTIERIFFWAWSRYIRDAKKPDESGTAAERGKGE